MITAASVSPLVATNRVNIRLASEVTIKVHAIGILRVVFWIELMFTVRSISVCA